VGYRIEVLFDLDMVVDARPGAQPLGKLTRPLRQRPHGRAIDLLEVTLARPLQLLERGLVNGIDLHGNGLVELGEREKLTVSQAAKNRPLCQEYATFRGGFIFWVANTGGQDGHTVVRSHLGVGAVERRLVVARLGDGRFGIVGDQDAWS